MGLPRFLSRIVDEIVADDSMTIVARGLGAKRLVAEVVRQCCLAEDKGVYLVLNLGKVRYASLKEALIAAELDTALLPRLAGSDLGREKRAALYATGENAVVALGCRVAIVDLLDGTLEAGRVKGVLVTHAERVAARGGGDSLESFVCRVVREQNPDSWIRAVSEEVEPFVRGFGKIDKVMKSLQLQRLSLWPRFEARTAASLARYAPAVVELAAQLTPRARRCQLAVVVALQSCLEELRGVTAGIVDAASYNDDSTNFAAKFFSGETCGFDAYSRAVNATVFPTARLSARSSQLLGELAAFRELLDYLSTYDSVALYSLVISAHSAAAGRRFPSKWVTNGAIVDELLLAAKSRVYEVEKGAGSRASKLKLVLEGSPKAQMVKEALSQHLDTTVVLVRDDFAALELGKFLERGAEKATRDSFRAFLEKANEATRKESKSLSAERRLLMDIEDKLAQKGDEKQKPAALKGEVLVVTHAQWVSHPDDPLQEWAPDRIVLVDAAPRFVREIECYCALGAKSLEIIRCSVVGVTADEAAYSASLESETTAFKRLITEKQIMLPTTREAHRAEALRRQAKLQNEEEKTLIVDSREFRSALPNVLHREVRLKAATLTVGDYVLSPDLVIERKSVNDLLSSLQSGRLYTQAEAMQRHYATPILLVESIDKLELTKDQEKYATSGKKKDQEKHGKKHDQETDEEALAPTTSVQARLAMLTLAYPRLRIVWSKDGNSTAGLFAALKRGRKQPSLEAAIAAGDGTVVREDEDENGGGGRNDLGIQILGRLPGVNEGNLNALIEHVDSLADLPKLTEEQLKPLIGPANAKKLHDFIRKEFDPTAQKSGKGQRRAWGATISSSGGGDPQRKKQRPNSDAPTASSAS